MATFHPAAGALALLLAILPGVAAARAQAQANDAGMYLQLITRMQQQGAWFASLAHIQAYRQQHGDSPGLQLAHADALRHTGEPEQARHLYAGLLRGPQRAAALHGLGLLAMQQQRVDEALEHLRQASALAPLQADYLGDLGYALLSSGQLAAARAPLAQAAELRPGDGRAVANLALWQLLSGNHQVALQMMQQAGLPEATAQAVQAQAVRLRQQWPAPSASAQAAPAAAPPAVPGFRSASGTAATTVQPPGSMLERFATALPSDPQASTP